MSIELMDADPALIREGCDEQVIEEATRSFRQVAKIVWDHPDTPEHCKGYTQWSVRPYRVTDRCDGTRDSNAMLVCLEYCKQTHLDLSGIFARAYPDEENIFLDSDYLAYLEEHRPMTEIDELTNENLIELLNSLYSMNWRSLTEELENAWAEMGFEVEEFWEDDAA